MTSANGAYCGAWHCPGSPGTINRPRVNASNWSSSARGPLLFSPDDSRRLFITDAILNGMPPHIAQLVVGHRDINTTMGYKAVYPEEVINGHRAFIARRHATRPSEEYRTPTDEEWQGSSATSSDDGSPSGPAGVHEHSCLQCRS
jgi:hypothetical protein